MTELLTNSLSSGTTPEKTNKQVQKKKNTSDNFGPNNAPFT